MVLRRLYKFGSVGSKAATEIAKGLGTAAPEAAAVAAAAGGIFGLIGPIAKLVAVSTCKHIALFVFEDSNGALVGITRDVVM